jgi:hypothetical protein
MIQPGLIPLIPVLYNPYYQSVSVLRPVFRTASYPSWCEWNGCGNMLFSSGGYANCLVC